MFRRILETRFLIGQGLFSVVRQKLSFCLDPKGHRVCYISSERFFVLGSGRSLMIEDKILVSRCKRGSSDALRRLYQKYKDDLLVAAMAILNDTSAAEDVVHDVFAAFVQGLDKFRLTGSLKGYLATCVANRARNVNRVKKAVPLGDEQCDPIAPEADGPDEVLVCNEQSQRLNAAMAQLPDEQREVIMLHVRGGMKFRQIAVSLGISANTAKSRYRYGIDKLRQILNERQER